MPGRERDPNLGPEDVHPGAPPAKEKHRIPEDRKAGEEKPKKPVGNSAQPDEPAAFPPHN
ncbi:MAG TPA: hypothetical protein VF875_06335 [Anaeromyxobacter sp.]